uniref:Coiled-coil domain-containing protein 176 n=1 Tax=Angiostrongylus cantonensis TaxID=6313 RepID=A0A0K0DLM7_ANGCA
LRRTHNKISDLKASLDLEKRNYDDKLRAVHESNRKMLLEFQKQKSQIELQVKNPIIEVDGDSDEDETMMDESWAEVKQLKRKPKQKIVKHEEAEISADFVFFRAWEGQSDVENPAANATLTSGLQPRFDPNLGPL